MICTAPIFFLGGGERVLGSGGGYCDHASLILTSSSLARMGELSQPIVRDTMDHVQFNPNAFNVSPAAKKARASARIEELSQPIRRGG